MYLGECIGIIIPILTYPCLCPTAATVKRGVICTCLSLCVDTHEAIQPIQPIVDTPYR